MFLWDFILPSPGKSLCVKKPTKHEVRSIVGRVIVDETIHPTFHDDLFWNYSFLLGRLCEASSNVGLDANGKLARPCDSTIYFTSLYSGRWLTTTTTTTISSPILFETEKGNRSRDYSSNRDSSDSRLACSHVFHDPASSFIKVDTPVERISSLTTVNTETTSLR